MEIYNKTHKGRIEVWLTNEEQQTYDRMELTEVLLSKVTAKKCKVVFFLSGHGVLFFLMGFPLRRESKLCINNN